MRWKRAAFTLIAAACGSSAAAAADTPAAPIALPPLSYMCGDHEEARSFAEQQLRGASASEDEYQSNLRASLAVQQAAERLHQQILAGGTAPPPYERSGQLIGMARAQTSTRLKELFLRAARDQMYRSDFSAALARQAWAAGRNEAAINHAFSEIGRNMCDLDAANTAWLKQEVAAHGWFTISRYGRDADAAAWVLVQHADQDRPFQAEVLKLLTPLVEAGESDRRDYAYLVDRVAVGEKRPQRYGTQGRCVGKGQWEPWPVEEPEKLDERRASVGMESEAQYKGMFTGCAGADPI